ncbi:MAG: L-2-amino-thiazoline-4-carboxylic acid hydrolase [Rubrobacter sp.]
MTDRVDFEVTPEGWYEEIEGGFFGILGERFGDSGDAAGLERDIRARQEHIEVQHASWIEDEQSRSHLRFPALALAGYRALRGVLPEDEAVTLLAEALIGPGRPHVYEGTKRALDDAPDPFTLMTRISKEKEASFYGRTFAFERPQDDEHAYLLNVTRCFWHRFFATNKALELMSVFCEWDTSWMDAVDPGGHGFRSERPTTLGYGGDACRFWFIRSNPARTPADRQSSD